MKDEKNPVWRKSKEEKCSRQWKSRCKGPEVFISGMFEREE